LSPVGNLVGLRLCRWLCYGTLAMVNKSGNIGREGEHYAARMLSASYPDAARRRDQKPSDDIAGLPFPVEVKRREKWYPGQWIRKVAARHDPGDWILYLVPRRRNAKDAPPECIVVSKLLFLEMLQAYKEKNDEL